LFDKVWNFDAFAKPQNQFPRWAEKEKYEDYKNFKFNLFFVRGGVGADGRDP
jgi:hypothetical protein